MFDDFHVEDDVEVPLLGGELLGGGYTIINVEGVLFGMDSGRADILFGRIYGSHLSAQPRGRLRQQPAAAADVEEVQALIGERSKRVSGETRGDLLANVSKP